MVINTILPEMSYRFESSRTISPLTKFFRYCRKMLSGSITLPNTTIYPQKILLILFISKRSAPICFFFKPSNHLKCISKTLWLCAISLLIKYIFCDILYNVSDTKYIFNVILACWHLLGSLFRSWIDINPIDADVNPCNILYT